MVPFLRLLRLSLALAVSATLWVAAGAQAQTAPRVERPFAALVAGWTRTLDQVADRASRPNLSGPEIDAMRAELARVRASANAAATFARDDLQAIRTLLAPLEPRPGPPGPDGKPTDPGPEADAVKVQREQLQAQATDAEGRIKQAELAVARADLLAQQVARTRDDLLLGRLVARDPSPFLPSTWIAAAAQAATALDREAASWREWGAKGVVGGSGGGDIVRLLSAALAVVLGWAALAWLRARYGRRPAVGAPSYRARVVAAAIEGLAMVVAPVAAIVVLSSALVGPATPTLAATTVQAIAAGGVLVLLVYGLTETSLAPQRPAWRLAPFSDASADLLATRCQRLAAAAAAVGVASDILLPDATQARQLHAAFGAVAMLTLFAFTLPALRSDAWQSAPPDPGSAAAGAGSVGGGRWGFGRLALAAVAAGTVVAAAAGYAALAAHVYFSLLSSMVAVALALILRGLANDLLDGAAAPDTPSGRWVRRALGQAEDAPLRGRFLLMIGVDLALVVGLAAAIPAIWGVDPDTIWEWALKLLTGLRIGDRTISLLDVALALGAFALALGVARFVRRAVRERVMPTMAAPDALRFSVDAAINYVGIVVACLVAVTTLGVDFSNLALIIGALSVGIGLGLQSIANNTISGIVLLLERPIKVGDWVVVGRHEGIVRRINVRATEIETFQRATVIVPNSEFLQSAVVNWTYADNMGRIDISVAVPFGSDVAAATAALREAAEGNPLVSRHPAPAVVFQRIGETGLQFELRAYLADVGNSLRARNELNLAVLERLAAAGISPVAPSPPPLTRLDLQEFARALRDAAPDGKSKPG